VDKGAPREGTLAALRGLLVTLVATLQVRLELLGTELAEERLRLLRVLVLGAVAFFLFGAGTVFSAGVIVVLAWDSHPALVLLLVALVLLAIGTLALRRALAMLQQPTHLFSASLAELAKDRDSLET
jgi:uncharacterized membrane protein YqjE